MTHITKKKVEKRVLTQQQDQIMMLCKKYPEHANDIRQWYGQDVVSSIDYRPSSASNILGFKNKTYADYLDLQLKSMGSCREGFEFCYFSFLVNLRCRGEVERRNKSKICFKRIFITATMADGMCAEEKEDHVWMDVRPFDEWTREFPVYNGSEDNFKIDPLQVGDCISFNAEIYRYVKTGNGVLLDYGLKDPTNIKRISRYDLPTDEELILQAIDRMICDACPINDQCYYVYCMQEEKRESLRKTLYSMTVEADRDMYQQTYDEIVMKENQKALAVVNEYRNIATNLGALRLLIKDPEQDSKTKRNAAMQIRKILDDCLFDENLSELTDIYCEKKTTNILGYDLDAISSFIKQMQMLFLESN